MMNDIIISAERERSNYWADFFRYRELLFFMVWRDLLVMYKQTAVGVAWALLKPTLTMLIFTFIFGKVASFPSLGVPYPILVLTGLLPWLFFSAGVGEAANSLLTNKQLVTKTYYPRMFTPISAILVNIVEMCISSTLLVLLMLYYQVPLHKTILLLPLFVLLILAFTIGASLLFSALNVKYRDFRYIIPFVLQLGLYCSPIGYSSTIIPAKWKLLFYLNPVAGIIDGFRWSILGAGHPIYWPGFLLSGSILISCFWIGIWYFRKTEQFFADWI